ncbi:hypothetical protein V6N12_021606 [Hibiscus sabdariffa]|uniref:Uncharacterized protein n=1 Tax=Hibiscus sabdariffa TaxID=183260 RepID=A0ABR2FSH4_9ROSI
MYQVAHVKAGIEHQSALLSIEELLLVVVEVDHTRLCISQVEGFIELISHSAGLLLELSLGLECEMV